MPSPSKMKRVADAVPQYPGRGQAERALRPVVDFVAGKWIRNEAERQVVRLVGFHAMWHEMRRQGFARPAVELVHRGAMKERTLYDCKRDFEFVFGVDVDDCSSDEVMRAAVGARPQRLKRAE